jgi:hypothetical protein
MPFNVIWLEQATHPVVLEADDAAAEPALRSFDLAGSLGHGHAREEWWADKLVVPPLGPQPNSSSCSQYSVGFHQKSDRAKVRDASRDQAWRRRCALARGGPVS